MEIWHIQSHRPHYFFPCDDSIGWIIKHVDTGKRSIGNAKGEPIASFRPEDLGKCYHLDKGTRKPDNKILDEFQQTAKEIYPKWYKLIK
jgi:hypothetical protein